MTDRTSEIVTEPAAEDGAEWTSMIEDWALEVGFDSVGIARLEPSGHGEYLRRWLERGDHAEMSWMERRIEVREDPAQLLEGARSAVCVALQYSPLCGESDPDGDLWPRVARYARGEDYHFVMTRRLDRLARRLEESFPGTKTRRYVDTGPILERELAARAGIGVIGKNTNLLNRERGSYFLLGELLTTLELSSGQPIADLCGRCTRCLDECPTEALREPYRLDSNRCISYWTIEHRGSIPREQRHQLGDWVFGCDVCQEVCPWNQKPRSTGDDETLRLPKQRAKLDLSGLLQLGRDDYVELFRRSPMKRAKLEGLQRNAAVAMGNRADEIYVDPLRQALDSSSSVVRSHAAWSLGRIGGEDVRGILAAAVDRELDSRVREELSVALAEC